MKFVQRTRKECYEAGKRTLGNTVSYDTKASAGIPAADARSHSICHSGGMGTAAAVGQSAVLSAAERNQFRQRAVCGAESTDYTDMDTLEVLYAFADGMKQELHTYGLTEQAEYTGTLGERTPAYGIRYTVTVNGTEMPSCTILFMVEHRIYCISFSAQTETDLFPYGVAFLEQLHFAE